MKTIPLTKGYFTKVDEDDYEKYALVRWFVDINKHGIPRARREVKVNGKIKVLSLSREIMNAPKDKIVDHINHDTLDNRKCNLRICTLKENMMNKLKYKNNDSGYKGVSYMGKASRRLKKWKMKLNKNGITVAKAYFDTKEDAARAYTEMAIKHYGEYAVLNTI